jgi:hypothetical protein
VCSPALESSFIEQARVQFVTDSIYLDDRPSIATLTQVGIGTVRMPGPISGHIGSFDRSPVRGKIDGLRV